VAANITTSTPATRNLPVNVIPVPSNGHT
jgi:hypothetical protein